MEKAISSDSRRVRRQAETFSRLGRELSAARTPKEAAQIVMDAADQLLHWDAFAFDLVGPELDNVVPILCIDTVDGERREFTSDATPTELSQIARDALANNGELILRAPGNTLPAQTIPFGNKNRSSASLMYVPLRKQSQTVGFLSLQSYSFNAYTREDLSTLHALADHCGGALERIRAEAEVDRLNRELRRRIEELHQLNLELEQRVHQRTAELQAINKELQAFCYSVSHDLRAPLRSIRGFSEVLLERYSAGLDERGQEFLQRVCHSCQHMDELIEDLLKLSRLSRAQMKLQRVDLSRVVQSIFSELQKNEPLRDVEVIVTSELHASGDERLLRVVLENLLRNAWKFTGNVPNPKIEFGLNQPDGAFFVRDNGAGFDMAYADRLFSVFQRLHTASEFPGAGVGLAIVQRIINRHGGRIWATGAPNQGATFYFTLPKEEKPGMEHFPPLPHSAYEEYFPPDTNTRSTKP